jgi:hypothetical protein
MYYARWWRVRLSVQIGWRPAAAAVPATWQQTGADLTEQEKGG